MKYVIRPIEPKDNKIIEQIIRDCLIEYGGNHEGTAWTDPNLGRFSEVYQRKGRQYFVAVNEADEIVGGAGIGELSGHSEVCELQKMYCRKEVRGCGIAHQLMETAIEYAKKYYKACYLETLNSMTRAQCFYEKHGFYRLKGPLGATGHFACDICYYKELEG